MIPENPMARQNEIQVIQQQMDEAFEQLGKDLVREFRTAVETIPHLVERETPFIGFLRMENFDAVKAARRLASYWKFRKEIFGERWLLPMTQTGTGALTMSDVQVLRTGYLHIVPTPGGPVVLSDGTRLFHALPDALDRCVFYMLTIFSDEIAQTQGGTLLSVVSSRKGPVKSIKQKQQMWEFVHTALPFKIRRAVVVQTFEEGKELLLEFLAYQQSRLLGFTSGVHTDLISENSFANTLRGLMKEGFGRSHIPNSLGGDFDYDSVAEFTRMRISIEDAMGSAPPKRNAFPCHVMMAATGGAGKASKTAMVKRTTNRKHGEEGEAFVKQRNATYARRSYHRRKLEVVVQQEQLTVLQKQNDALHAERLRLEALLAEASRIVVAVQNNGILPCETPSTLPINSPRISSGDSVSSRAGVISESDSGISQTPLASRVMGT